MPSNRNSKPRPRSSLWFRWSPKAEVLTKPGELVGIQVLRGIAATMVVLHHALEESLYSKSAVRSPDWLITAGAAGVDIFFVISGFVMIYASYPRARAPDRPLGFLVKRIARIYPLYWLFAFGALTLQLFGFFSSRRFDLPSIMRSLFLIPSHDPIINVSWTLCFEIYFYLAFAAILSFRSLKISILGSTSFLVLSLVCSRDIAIGPVQELLTNPLSLEFCFGMILAWCTLEGHLEHRLATYGWTFGFGVIMIAPILYPGSSTNGLPIDVRPQLWGLSSVIIIWSFIAIGNARLLSSRMLRIMGDSSYAIYLSHPFIMVAYGRVLRSSPSLAEASQLPIVLVVVAISVGLGIFIHLYFERPLLVIIRATGVYRRATRGRLMNLAIMQNVKVL